MNNKELLTTAAKAAGYDVVFVHDDNLPMRRDTRPDGKMKHWNPLNSDEDAFKLMVDLQMEVCVWSDRININSYEAALAEKLKKGDCKYEVTRRAIVICAAKIGEKRHLSSKQN